MQGCVAGHKFSLFLLVAACRVLCACQSACLPERWVSGKDLARNRCRVPLNCRSWVTVSLLIIDLQIFVHVWRLFSPNWGFALLPLPSTTFSKIGNSNYSFCSGQHSNMSQKSSRIKSFEMRFLMLQLTVKSKKLPRPSYEST